MLNAYKYLHNKKLLIFRIFICPCLGLGLLMSYLCDLFFIFIFIFIIMSHTISLKQSHLFFTHFLEYTLLFLDDYVDEKSEWFSNSKSSASRFCLAFAHFFTSFSLVLLIKVLLIKNNKCVSSWNCRSLITKTFHGNTLKTKAACPLYVIENKIKWSHFVSRLDVHLGFARPFFEGVTQACNLNNRGSR